MAMPTLKARRDEALGGPPGQVRVELASVTKRFLSPTGTVFTAISDVTMSVGAGQFCAVVGPTGCGKSTMLSMVSGLDRPSGGAIRVNGAPVRGIVDGVGFMFQADALLPWKSVLDNVSPGRIKAVYEIDLPRPRGTAQQLRFHPRFVELQRRIWESLRDEVQRAYQRSATGTPVTAAEGREL